MRKVNGAKVMDVLIMLNSGFAKWVAMAFIVASPAVFYVMNKWLQNFVYRIEIKWWFFVIPGLTLLIVTLVTVSLQCWRIASKNPVETLRYE